MIQRSNSGRRILTYPAVHPCEAIAPETLLDSLISLTHNICSFKSRFFASNNRNAVQAIRQIGVVRVFLEEVRDGLPGFRLPGPAVLSFSELHLTFQKVQLLLEDCTRDDARVWMLMNSDRVSNQFRVLIRSMATALDVLPLGSFHVADEVKEQVELVLRHARRSKFEVDPEDKRVVEAVKSVLFGFEKRVDPDKTELKRVLDHVGFRRWSRCEKEVRFLESEIGLENLRGEKREVGLLSSLKGLLCYCRCVMFDTVDGSPGPRPESKSGSSSSEFISCLNLEDFRCPISLEMMADPVTIATGQSYDRSSITKWFKSGKPICPKTGEKLKNMEMVPNLALRRLIQQYCFENGIRSGDSGPRNRDIVWTKNAGSSAAEGAMIMVAQFLCSILEAGSTVVEKNKAAYEIRLLSKTSIFNRSCLVEAGVVRHLLKLLALAECEAQENAMAGLLNLSKHTKGKAEIVENGGVDLVVDVLKEGLKVEACQHAAGTLFYVASIEEYRVLIGENPRAISALRDLIKNGSDRGKKNALVAIFGLLMHPGNHKRVLAAEVVPLLFDVLTSVDSDVLVTDSLAILATLSEKPEGAVAIVRCKALDSIVGILNSSTSKAAKEFCASMLLALCVNCGHNVVALLVKSPSLMGSLYSQLSEGTSRASKKASSLIKVLHDFNERRSSGPVSCDRVLTQERFVHVR